MSGGISRVHGGVYAPKNFSGVSLQDFTLQFWGGPGELALVWADFNGTGGTGYNTTGTGSVANGALDQIFRTALETFGTVSRIGILNTATSQATMNFALESLGVDAFSPSGLGLGSVEGSTASTTAVALTNAVTALCAAGATINGVHVNSCTVVAYNY